MESKKNIDSYFKHKSYMKLLHLLEQDLYQTKLIYPNISEKDILNLIHYALDWETKDYWQSLAIEWLSCSLPINKVTRTKLEKISNNKSFSKNVRHKVLKLLK